MTESQQQLFAEELHATAVRMAFITSNQEDRQAATMAILAHAFTLSTPHLSDIGRARIFKGEEE